MNELSKERLENYASGSWYPDADYVKAMARELLELRERAEPEFYGPYTPVMVGAGVWVSIADELPPHLEGRKVWVTTSPTAPPAPVVPDEITADFKLVSRKKCMKCDQTVFGYTVNGLCEECYMSEQATPVLPECLERLLRHAHGLTSGTDWNAGTAAKFHRDPLIQAVKDCRAAMLKAGPEQEV